MQQNGLSANGSVYVHTRGDKGTRSVYVHTRGEKGTRSDADRNSPGRSARLKEMRQLLRGCVREAD